MVFVLDESSSIGANGFQLIREFAEEISRSLDIGLQRSLVGVILFSSSARVYFPVTQHTDAGTLLLALNSLPYNEGDTDTAAALNLLRTAGRPGGALKLRSRFNHIAVIVTDGKSNNEAATLTAADALHMSGIYDQVYTVGISGADATELNVIASDSSLVFFTGDSNSIPTTRLERSITEHLPCESRLYKCFVFNITVYLIFFYRYHSNWRPTLCSSVIVQ